MESFLLNSISFIMNKIGITAIKLNAGILQSIPIVEKKKKLIRFIFFPEVKKRKAWYNPMIVSAILKVSGIVFLENPNQIEESNIIEALKAILLVHNFSINK